MGWIAAIGARGQVVTLPPPPGGGEIYGPLAGAQAVRDGTTPLAVTHPGGSPTVVTPGDNIATKITTAGTGGTLWFTKGTHVNTSRKTPLAGQTLVFESAAGNNRTAANSAIIDGQNANFESHFMTGAANVTIRGGVFTRQGNSAGDASTWHATILHDGTPGAGGWLVEDAVITANRNTGLKFQGPNCTARRTTATNNGRYGITSASIGSQTANILFEYCEVGFNNARILDPGDNAGGSKFTQTNGIICRYCYVHDNWGPGLWADLPGHFGNVQFRENVLERNRRAGIFLEGVLGGCVVHRNYCLNNGWDPNSIGGDFPLSPNAAIKITHADSTLGSGVRGVVSRNDIDFNLSPNTHDGWMIFLWNHNPPHPNQMRAWDVFENRMWLRNTTAPRVGGQDQDPSTNQLWDGNIVWSNNKYHVANPSSPANYWSWGTGAETGSSKSYTQWRAFHAGEAISLASL
jgi:hypothetical protein